MGWRQSAETGGLMQTLVTTPVTWKITYPAHPSLTITLFTHQVLFHILFQITATWMMETGIEEGWEMVDYYPPFKDEDEEQEKSQVSWVRVIHAGKKVVIAGLVLTSLPFLLPPMVVISALGLALSVPYGVVLASYACTHKLMTKLLPPTPTPTPSPTHQDELEGFVDMENEFDEIRRREEEPEGYNNLDDVVAEKDEKPYFNVDMNQGENFLQEKNENKENVTSEKQGENFLQEIIITETEKEEKEKGKENGINEIIISETKREEKDEGEENEKEREKIINETKRENGTSENLLQEKNNTEAEAKAKRGEKNEQMKRGSKESGKQRKKKKNGGKRKDGEGEGSAGEVIALIQQETNQGNIHEKIEAMVQDDSGGGMYLYTALII